MTRLDRRFSVAPMMDWTDRHGRYFLRVISRHALLYTEMVTTGALIHGDRERFLRFDPRERPLALQLGGSDPAELGRCAEFAVDYGYDEVNLNIGCPSDRVTSGRFGACLMAEPRLVADCVAAINEAGPLPATVKTRLGIDQRDSYAHLTEFISAISMAGCKTVILHARKAWLSGLSPKQNREVPPLRYHVVHRVKQDFPDLEVIINGGFKDLEQVSGQLDKVDGVMIGREVYQNPYLLASVDQRIFGAKDPVPTRYEILEDYLAYVEGQLSQGVYLKHMTRHLLGLFQGQPGARSWRRHLSENAYKPGAGVKTVREAMALVDPDGGHGSEADSHGRRGVVLKRAAGLPGFIATQDGGRG